MLGRTRRHLLIAALALAVLAVPVAGAQQGVLADAIAGLQRDPVYVHPAAETILDDRDADRLQSRIRSADAGPIYIAVLPAAAADEAGGDPTEVLIAVAEGVGRRGTFAVVVGRTLRAGATEGTPFGRGDVPAAADRAVEGNQGQDAAAVLTAFVAELERAATGAGGAGRGGEQGREQGREQGSGGGIGLLPVLLIGGAGAFVVSRVIRRRREQRELDEVRVVAREDLTTFANDLYDLDAQLQMPDSDAEAKAEYAAATEAYLRARDLLERAGRAEDFAAVTEALEEGRYLVARAKARLEGRPLPEHSPPCFFNPAHGPSTREVEWMPAGGTPRAVPACEADALRVESGAEPDVREVTVGGYRRAYWDTPAYFGNYYGGWYGGFGGLGFLSGMLWGSMLGGGFGWGHGPIVLGGGGFGGGDFGGGDFGGGDFGGGDFGGGDFGGGGDF